MPVSRRVPAALAALLLAGSIIAAPFAGGREDFALDRVAGNDRYETAANAALLAFSAGSEAAVLARGDAFPDALAGSYLTGVVGAPILLTTPSEVPEATSTALETLGATTVYLLGGTAAISSEVEEDLKADHEVVRIAGDNRYGTAAEIATQQEAAGIGELAEGRAAILASGASFADALAAGPLAHAAQLPILLTEPGALPATTKAALDELEIAHVVIAGGTAAVSDAVKTAVEEGERTSERIAGADRYATAAAIADFALSNVEGWSDDGIDLATGEKFADALAAGPASGELQQSILLTATAALSGPTRTWLVAHAGTLLDGRVFGGTAAVSDATLAAAEAAGSGTGAASDTGQVTFVDKAADTYRFVPDGGDSAVSVTYKSTDAFTVDGASASVGGFETNLSPADTIRHVAGSGTAPARHELTNVDATKIVEGTVGNVDIEGTEFDIVHPVDGGALRTNINWDAAAYKIDGASASDVNFEDDINEGDTIEIVSGTNTRTLELTNEEVEGAANTIESADLPPSTLLKVGGLGDIPDAGTDETTDPAGQDDRYEANGSPVDTDTFSVDGTSDAAYGDFADALTAGDVVTYSRDDGVEHFSLVNRAPTTTSGQAVDDLDPDGDPNPLPGSEGGGTFTIATESGTVAVEYIAEGTYVVDGKVASETEFESAYTAGDDVKYRQADEPSGTAQRLELTNRALAGVVDPDSVDTEADTYGVLAKNGQTILATVTYVGEEGANTYFVNGAAATLEAFETELTAISEDKKTGTVQVTTSGSGDSAVTQHRLATAAAT